MKTEQQKNELSPQTVRENGFFKRLKRDLAALGELRVICFAAMLAAMSLILGKFLQIPNPFQEFIRISFENLPIILSGIAFGPFVGAMTGTVADLLGCLLYGYAINPLVTLGAAAVGLLSGAVSHYMVIGSGRRVMLWRVVLSAVIAHLIGSVFIKSMGLAAWYLGSYNMGLAELMLWRLLTYTIIGVAESVILCLLFRHRAFVTQLERMRKK